MSSICKSVLMQIEKSKHKRRCRFNLTLKKIKEKILIMISICFLAIIALSNCEVPNNAMTSSPPRTSNTKTSLDVSLTNLTTEDTKQSNASRKNFPLPSADSKLAMKSHGEDKDEMDGVVLALSMKKFKGGAPRWYTQWKNAAKTLFDGISQRRSKQIRFRGQDPSVTIDLKAEAVVPALKELLSSKQVQKMLNNLASKAAIVYRSFQEDYVRDKSA